MEESLEVDVSQDDSRFADDDELDADGAPPTVPDADELAAVVRPDFVARVFKSLSADAERGDGELQRADVNRTYLRRQLSVAECMEVEDQLAVAGWDRKSEASCRWIASARPIRRGLCRDGLRRPKICRMACKGRQCSHRRSAKRMAEKVGKGRRNGVTYHSQLLTVGLTIELEGDGEAL